MEESGGGAAKLFELFGADGTEPAAAATAAFFFAFFALLLFFFFFLAEDLDALVVGLPEEDCLRR